MAAIDMPATPENPSTFKAQNGVTYVWDGQKWTSLGATVISNESAAVTATAPTNPVSGTLWYDTTVERLKVFVNGAWKDVRPSS